MLRNRFSMSGHCLVMSGWLSVADLLPPARTLQSAVLEDLIRLADCGPPVQHLEKSVERLLPRKTSIAFENMC